MHTYFSAHPEAAQRIKERIGALLDQKQEQVVYSDFKRAFVTYQHYGRGLVDKVLDGWLTQLDDDLSTAMDMSMTFYLFVLLNIYVEHAEVFHARDEAVKAIRTFLDFLRTTPCSVRLFTQLIHLAPLILRQS